MAKKVSEEGGRPAFLGPTKSAEEASVLRHRPQQINWFALMAAVRLKYQFFLPLDQSVILAMKDEARWMIKNNLTTEKQVPDFLDYIYEDGLKAVNRKQ